MFYTIARILDTGGGVMIALFITIIKIKCSGKRNRKISEPGRKNIVSISGNDRLLVGHFCFSRLVLKQIQCIIGASYD